MNFVVLPIDAAKPALFRALETSLNLVVVAQTGAGKTTRLPVFLDEFMGPEVTNESPIVVLEPRRVLAVSAANRIASEFGWTQSEVGFAVRGQSQYSAATRILFMTEGLFFNQLITGMWDNRFPSAVVFDEFHERSLEADLILGILRERQLIAQSKCRIVAMSATIETERLRTYLADSEKPAAVVQVPGRLFPVEVKYSLRPLSLKLDSDWVQSVAETVEKAIHSISQLEVPAAADAAILVFLPGRREIRSVKRVLESACEQNRFGLSSKWLIQELHAGLSLAEQSQVIQPTDHFGRPRVILSTNLAESSVTIEDVRAVVDSGVERRSVLLPSGLAALKVFRIAKSSAEQRKGRAGRTQSGLCFRMWSETDHRSASDFVESDLQSRASLETAFLLATAGYSDPSQFEWYEPPKFESALREARSKLERLNVVGRDGQLSQLGLQMKASGLSFLPALFWSQFQQRNTSERKVNDGTHSGFANETHAAAEVAAILSEPDFERGAKSSFLSEKCELLHQRAKPGLDLRQVDWILRIVKKLAPQPSISKSQTRGPLPESVLHELIRAYSLQLGRLRMEGDRKRAVLSGGGELHVDEDLLNRMQSHEFFIAFRANTTTDNQLGERSVANLIEPISKKALEISMADAIESRTSTTWIETEKATHTVRGQFIGTMPLSPLHRVETDAEQALPILSEQLKKVLQSGRAAESFNQVLSRIRFHMGRSIETTAPDSGSPFELEAALAEFALSEATTFTRRKLFHLRDIESDQELGDRFLIHLQGTHWSFVQSLSSGAPASVKLASTRIVPLIYGANQHPKISVRLQWLIGTYQTPVIGKHPYSFTPDIEILGPHGRPIQMTRDLASFWRGSYHEIRKELRGRYPKHAWPEDPLTAAPLGFSDSRDPKGRAPK